MTDKKRGRPRVQETSVKLTLSVDHEHLRVADRMVAAFDSASTLGVRHSRMDVLRAALARGLAQLQTEVEGPAKG